jgi:hypothetical protein
VRWPRPGPSLSGSIPGVPVARRAVVGWFTSVVTEPNAAHYLVTGVGAAAVVATVTLGAPGAGRSIAGTLCGSAACTGPPIPQAPVGTCRVISHADTVTEDAVVFSDDLGRAGRLTLSRTIDKNAVVHWFVRQDGTAAGELPTGMRALVGNAAGRVTEFASEQVAREFVVATEHEPVKRSLAAVDAAGALPLLGDRIDGHATPDVPVDTYLVDGGDGLDLVGETRSAMDGPRVPQASDGLAAVRLVSRPDVAGTAVTYRLAPSVATTLGVLAPAGSTGSGGGTGRTVLTVMDDDSGRPQRLVLEVAGALPGALGQGRIQQLGTSAGSGLTALLPPLASPPPTAPSLDSFAGRLTLSVDLTDRRTRRIAADALHAMGVPVLLGDGSGPWSASPAGAVTRPRARPPTRPGGTAGGKPTAAAPSTVRTRAALQQFYRLFDTGVAGTSVTVNTYRTDGAGVTPQVVLGLLGGLTFMHSLPADDYYYAPGHGFVKWQECRQ